MFPVSKPQQCVSAASSSNVDAEAENTTRDLPDLGSVATMRVCRVCLAMSVKMYHMSEHRLNVMYLQVTGVEIDTEDKLPKMLCWECVARLSSANNFIDKALKTLRILMDKIKTSGNVTISDIESINRAHYNIVTTLGCKVIIENDSNFCYPPENYEGTDHFKIEESGSESCELNDIGISNEEQIITDVNVIGEKDPIKTEYLDVTDEQNASDENYKKYISDEKDTIKREYLDVTEEQNISDEDYNEEKVFEVPIYKVMHKEDNQMLGEAREVCEEVKQSQKKIHSKVTPLQTRRKEALSQCKELHTQDSFKQIKQEILEEKNNLLEKMTTNTEICDSENTSNIASVSTSTVDSNINLMPDDTEYTANKHTKDTFTCNYCGYASYLKRRLSIHINTMHTKNISFNCSHCSYKAYDKRTLTRHVNAKHTKKNIYNCSLCSYNSYDKSNLTRHVNNKHTKTNVFSCSYCNFRTFQQSNLNAHVKVKHTKTDVYNCSLCSYEAYDKGTLTKHVNAKHTETNVHDCPYCSFKTYLKGNLNQHINAKHTKTNIYNCDYCSFKTYQRGSLNVHVNAKHTKANVYNCDYCSFITYQNGSLSAHVNAKHVKKKVYNCSLCSYTSYRKSSLSAHISSKHT